MAVLDIPQEKKPETSFPVSCFDSINYTFSLEQFSILGLEGQ